VRLCWFDDWRPGLALDAGVVDLAPHIASLADVPAEDRLQTAIKALTADVSLADRAMADSPRPWESVSLRAPAGRYSHLYCAQGNYFEGRRQFSRPQNMFVKATSAILDPGGTIRLPPVDAVIFHHEAELAVVIGRRAVNVSVDQALDYVFGYTCFMDVSARGVGRPLDYLAKSPDTFAPLGPWITTKDEVPDPQALEVRLEVNGRQRQLYGTDDMEHSVAQIVSWTSSMIPLDPGDVLGCGTNHQGLGPLQDGDRIRMEITGIGGELSADVVDPQSRVWPDQIDSGMGRAIRKMREFGVTPPMDEMFTLRQIEQKAQR
jgi:2-keto-4-pentenoate hydratase/2-oxohepta-3-ene-1,7-dioic acid hydratase in catechol pathway